MPIAFFKDRFLPEEQCHISIHDRSFRFGDGLFETLLVYNGRIYDFPAHHKRLRQGLTALRIDLDTSHIEALCHEVMARNGVSEGFLRIMVSRGENGADAVGYWPKGCQPWLMIQAIAKSYPAFRELTLWLSSQTARVHLPGKTNNALIYTLAMLEAQEHGCDNALLLTSPLPEGDFAKRTPSPALPRCAGEGDDRVICETASGSIFWIKGDTLYTPSLDVPMVPGTIRRRALELWQGPREEGRFTLDSLKNADEICMTNTGCILAAVTAIRPLGITRPVGPHTKSLRQALDQDILTACGAK